jgi:predicted NUDIX family phosphoesterase
MVTREEECILVIPRKKASRLTSGFLPIGNLRADQIIMTIRTTPTFLPRHAAEITIDYIQPIALAYIEHDDSLLVLHRDAADRSDALRGRNVVWVGGHINLVDAWGPTSDGRGGPDAIFRGLQRELDEELRGLPPRYLPKLVGIVADDSSDRSRMHLGLVHGIRLNDDLAARAIAARSRGAPALAFVPIAELRARSGQLEPWSRSIVTGYLATDHELAAAPAADAGPPPSLRDGRKPAGRRRHQPDLTR